MSNQYACILISAKFLLTTFPTAYTVKRREIKINKIKSRCPEVRIGIDGETPVTIH